MVPACVQVPLPHILGMCLLLGPLGCWGGGGVLAEGRVMTSWELICERQREDKASHWPWMWPFLLPRITSLSSFRRFSQPARLSAKATRSVLPRHSASKCPVPVELTIFWNPVLFSYEHFQIYIKVERIIQ